MRVALSRLVASAPSLHVCGAVGSGLEALDKILQLNPDVIALDVEMSSNGLEALQRIVKDSPLPVVMVTALTPKGSEMTPEALLVGAFDYLDGPLAGIPLDPEELRRDLVERIEAAAHGPLARKRDSITPATSLAQTRSAKESYAIAEIVAIGASTGGPKALLEILPQLPADLPVGILIVQHMPPGLTAPLAKRLDSICKLPVCEAANGEVIEPGMVYIAPAGMHTRVWRKSDGAAIRLSQAAPEVDHVPSVDVMMLSVSEVYGRHAMGVILTGMGRDGLRGMAAIAKAGGLTIGQDKATCAVYGMPRCCAENGVLQKTVPLSQIPSEILQAVRYRAPVSSFAARTGV